MSRLFDRPTGPPTLSTPVHPSEVDPTGPPGSLDAPRPSPPPTLSPEPRLEAPAKRKRDRRRAGGGPVVPASSVTGSSLTLVVTIMCFLACLTAGAVYMVNQSATAWLKDVASEVSVQLEPVEKTDMEQRLAKVAFFLARQPGIKGVRPYTAEESAKLLEPWLGQLDGLKSLPVPRLIALELDRTTPPDFDKLRAALKKNYTGVTLDDHRHWQRQIRTVTRSLGLGGLAILVLVGAATTAIIISATRSAMASNREIVEVLHFVGATDRFIAREFERHFLRLGIRAGFVGAICAMVVFYIMPTVMQLLGGGSVTLAELNRLIGSGNLDVPGYFLLGVVVIVIAALCMLTSRYGVYRILHARN